jgi:hypothetical protein
MTRTKSSPGIKLYYKALQEIFDKQSKILTGVLTHYGERGRNDEKFLIQFLEKILPTRFSIGSGFIVSSDNNKNPSSQNDIIIFDQFWNSPLYKEITASVYPIEAVYGTIEVKGLIEKSPKGRKPNRKSDIDRALENIKYIRGLSKDKKYIRYTGEPKSQEEPDKIIVNKKENKINLPPRSYIFAYAKKGWRDIQDFKIYLQNKLNEYPEAHLHGIIILEKNWFAFQVPYMGKHAEVHVFSDNALLRFTNTLLMGIQSMPMDIASIDDYHHPGLYKGFLNGDPSEFRCTGDPEPPDASLEGD